MKELAFALLLITAVLAAFGAIWIFVNAITEWPIACLLIAMSGLSGFLGMLVGRERY